MYRSPGKTPHSIRQSSWQLVIDLMMSRRDRWTENLSHTETCFRVRAVLNGTSLHQDQFNLLSFHLCRPIYVPFISLVLCFSSFISLYLASAGHLSSDDVVLCAPSENHCDMINKPHLHSADSGSEPFLGRCPPCPLSRSLTSLNVGWLPYLNTNVDYYSVYIIKNKCHWMPNNPSDLSKLLDYHWTYH